MKPIIRRTLDWIPQAPVCVTRTRRIAAPAERVWAAVADHERWAEWFPGLTRVEVFGSGEGVGGRRRVHIKQFVTDEEFLVWEPHTRFAFTLTAVNLPLLRSMVEDVRLDRESDTATTVSYTQAVEPVAARITAPIMRRMFAKQLDRGLAGLATHVHG